MSTYLPGVTDTGFNPINYTPNFSMLANALDRATARYETNFNQISNSYSKIADAFLLNPENIEYRKNFLNNAKDKLKQLSTTDLSIQSNVNEANKLFSPFWEDEDLLADYAISKQYQSQVAEYNRLKNSDKKEDRDRAWDEGLEYVQMTAQDMKHARRGDGSIRKVNVNEYVPYIEPSQEINKFLNESGYKDGIVSYRNDNGHLVQVINGDGSKNTYNAVIDNYIKNRPDLQKIFEIQGTVDFQKSVNSLRNNYPELSKEEAEQKAKSTYASYRTNQYKKYIDNYTSILKGTNSDEGIESKFNKLKTELDAQLDKGISPTQEQLKQYKDYQTQIYQASELIKTYNSEINNLNSDDFNNPNVNINEYFGNQYRHIFSEGMAAARAAASSEKIVTDSYSELAMRLISHQQDQDRKYGSTQETVRVDSKGNTVITKKGYNQGDIGSEIIIPSDENIQIGVKESSQKLSDKKADIPIVVRSASKNEELENSFWYNFNKNNQKERDIFISGVSNYVNTSKELASSFPGIYKYVDYLSALVTGTVEGNKKIGSAEELKKTFNELKSNETTKSYFSNFDGYNSTPVLQLKALLDYVDASTTSPDLDRATLRPIIDQSATKFSTGLNIIEDFKKEKLKEKPSVEYMSVVKKDKTGAYRQINATDIINDAGDVGKYKDDRSGNANQLFRNIGHTLLPSLINEGKAALGDVISFEKLPKELANAYLNGTLKIDKVIRPDYSPSDSDGIPYVTTYEHKNEDGTVYDLTSLVRKMHGLLPKDIKEKLDGYNKEISSTFQQHLKSKYPEYEPSFVMNNKLEYSNDPQTSGYEKATLIAKDAISNNLGNIIEKSDGIILPSNYDQLTKIANKDQLDDVLKIIFSNPDELDKVLSKTELSYSGQTNDKSSVRLIFDADKLNNLVKNVKPVGGTNTDLNKQVYTAIQSLVTNGLELNIDNNIFLKYANDDYMSSVVTDELLSKGITASDYEKNKLFYDYTLVSGANNEIIVKYKVKKYNPNTNSFKWVDFEPQSYPKSIGVDAILKSLRESFLPNTQSIYSYLNQNNDDKENNKTLFEKKQGESSEQRIDRLFF